MLKGLVCTKSNCYFCCLLLRSLSEPQIPGCSQSPEVVEGKTLSKSVWWKTVAMLGIGRVAGTEIPAQGKVPTATSV